MKLFYKDTKPDFSKIHDATSKGYGVQHPERIHGYAGAFLFTLLDVYLSERLEQLLEQKPELVPVLQNLLNKFKNEEYGDVSPDDEYSNVEQRYICGGHYYMIARYDTDAGRIIFESFFDMSLLYLEGEDITAIRESQELKRKNHRHS